MTVEPMVPEDAADVLRIAQANGLPAWSWTPGAFGTVARSNGRVVAFCAVRETPQGLLLDELWEERSKEGLLGLGRLAKWAEELAQRLSDERGKDVWLGGIVMIDNQPHKKALEHRGYATVAEVLGKAFHTQKGVVA